MKKIITLLFLLVISLSINNSSFGQANSVGLNGSFTFNSIQSAYNAIGAVGSPQLIELSAIYTGVNEVAPVTLTNKAGVSAINTITIRPLAGANGLTLSKASAGYIIRFDSCKFVIVDGRPGGVISAPANYLTITNTTTAAAAGATGMFGSENCNFQYINANGVSAATGCRTINLAGGVTVASKNNVIQNNIVKGGLRGIQNFGTVATLLNVNDTIRNNDISQYFNIGILSANNSGGVIKGNRVHFTSAIPTVATFLSGIQVQSNGTLITENEVDNMTSSNATSITHMTNFGTDNVYSKNNIHDPIPVAAAFTQVSGIQFSGNGAVTFTENQIHDFTMNATTAGGFIIGLQVANNGTAAATLNLTKNKIYNFSSPVGSNLRAMSVFPFAGTTVNIENNFVSITAQNAAVAAIFGILIGNVNITTPYTSNIYYNSVRIGGSRVGGALGSVNSYGILKSDTNATSTYRQKNNISINERTTGDANTNLQIASWIGNTYGTLDIDYNNYYATDTLGGVAGGWVDTLYTNLGLAGYKAYASPHEQNTTFSNVTFVSNTDLHLAGSSIGDPDLIGTPIVGIPQDIDNQLRSAVKPYKGADESSTGLSTLTLTINFEAYPTTDTITVQLRNSTLPYALVEQVKGFGGADTPQPIHFANAVDGVPYYVVVKYRNGIETWSSGTPTFTGHVASYDFTTALTQAFGSNMKLVGGIPSIFQGDVNQSGNVNLADVLLVTNDAAAFVTGPYLNTDFNGSGTVNLADILVASNNNTNFVVVKKPAGATPNPDPIVNDNVTVTSNRNTSIPVSSLNIRSAEQVGNAVLMEK